MAQRRASNEPLNLLSVGNKRITPPLKWAGGKRWLLPTVEPIYRQHEGRRLVELLCGGLAVTTGLAPANAIANDINEHAINFYQWLRRGLKVTIAMENDETAYYEHRNRFNALIRKRKANTAVAAQIFYYLNRTGFNGLCRFNKRGEFNVPFGRYAKINYRTDFREYKAAFAEWDFTCLDFEDVPIRADDFIYADPPYDVPFTQYSAGGFGWDDQVRLAEYLAQHRGPVLLSNQATPRIVQLYRSLDYSLQFLDAPRRISCTGDRTPAPEVLASRGV